MKKIYYNNILMSAVLCWCSNHGGWKLRKQANVLWYFWSLYFCEIESIDEALNT